MSRPDTLTAPPPPAAPAWRALFVRDATAAPSASRVEVAWLFAPAAALVAFLRLVQSLGLRGNPELLGGLVMDFAPLPCFVVATAAFAGWMVGRTYPHVRPVWIVAGTLLAGGGLLATASAVLPPWQVGWLTPRAFERLRWDLLVLLVLALGSVLVLGRLRGHPRAAFRGLMYVLVVLLVLLPVFELGGILSLGAAPDWPMLAYTFMHLGELLPVLASETGPLQAMLLVLPLGLVALPLARLRRLRLREAPRTGRAQPLLLASLPALLVLALPPSADLPPTERSLSYAGMARSIAEYAGREADPALDAAAPVPFDAEALRLVPADSTRRLNVVVLLLESFRSRSVTPYAPDLDTTPFLDSLAQHSLLVETMYAVVPYTNKSLAPILAGIYPEQTYGDAETRGIPGQGLPALLRPHGYRSAFFTPATFSFERKDLILQNLGFETLRGDGDFPTDGFHKANYFGYEDRSILEPTLAWVDEAAASGDPFFLTLLTLTSHHDYQLPPGYPETNYADEPRLNGYLNTLRYTDDFVRDLFEGFRARGLLDETLFILLGDHGEAFGEHGLWSHGSVIFDEALQIPALLHQPALFPEAGRVEGPRLYLDVLPTVADALGYRIEGGTLPGHSLLAPAAPGRTLYHHTRDGRTALALRRDSLKFVYHHRRQPMQVFNLLDDPLERRDLAATLPPELLKAAEMELLLWRRGVQRIYD